MSRRPLVAIDVRPLALPHVTGVGLLVQQVVEELTPCGFDFVAVCDRAVPEGRLPAGLPVRLAAGAGGRVRWESVRLPALLRSLSPPPDLFHATWNHGIPRGLQFPSVLSLLDLIPWVHPGWVPWPAPAPLHRWLYGRAVRASSERAAAIVTISEASRRDIAARLPDAAPRVEVVPCAVPRWMRPPDPAAVERWRSRFGGRPYWLYLGGFDPRKGLEVLFEAVAECVDEWPLAPALVLAGAPNEYLKRLPAGMANPQLAGYVPDPDLPDLFGGAELFLYPSRYEGFGIPPLLAMACGVPCVVADGGSLPEVVGDAAVVVKAGTPARCSGASARHGAAPPSSPPAGASGRGPSASRRWRRE